MDPRTYARAAGLLGGLSWVVRLVLDLNGSGSGTPSDLLRWAGLVLLAVALAALGASLVSRSALWLRVIVGVAFPLLVWSVLEVLHPAGDPEAVDGVFGALAAVVAAVGLLRSRPPRRRTPAGAHSR